MKKLFLLLLIVSLPALSQTATDIDGHWQFKEIVATKDMDDKAVEMLTGYFKDTSFDFNPNNKYLAALMGNADTGTWKLTGKNIELTSDKGEVYELNIIDFKKGLLSVKIRNAAFTLTRVSDSELKTGVVISAAKSQYITVTKEQLAKKWFLKQPPSKGQLTPEMAEALQKMAKGSFLNFSLNGDYNASVLGITDEGRWHFGEDKSSIVTTNGADKNFWNVIEITATRLVLVKGNSKEQWLFSTME